MLSAAAGPGADAVQVEAAQSQRPAQRETVHQIRAHVLLLLRVVGGTVAACGLPPREQCGEGEQQAHIASQRAQQTRLPQHTRPEWDRVLSLLPWRSAPCRGAAPPPPWPLKNKRKSIPYWDTQLSGIPGYSGNLVILGSSFWAEKKDIGAMIDDSV